MTAGRCNETCMTEGECSCMPVSEFPDRLDKAAIEAQERARLFACDELMADEAGRLTLRRSTASA